MNDRSIAEALREIAPPDLAGARERAKLAARVELHLGHKAVDRRRRATLSSKGRRLPGSGSAAVAGLALLVIVVLGATQSAPGRAAVSWAGDQIGIGEPGGEPSIQPLRAAWERGTASEGAPAFVLARGPAPGGGHWEFVTFQPQNQGTRCFEVNLPEQRLGFSVNCERLPGAEGQPLLPPLQPSGGLQILSAGGNAAQGQEIQLVAGRTSNDVSSIEVREAGSPVPSELQSIPGELANRFGLRDGFKVFIAFLPNSAGDRVEIVGRDTTDAVVATQALRLPDIEAFRAGAQF
jgi:hypothetical protein